ncbi:MAG TPA: VOC family protein [Candidatus Angelobacter sp.]|jgi:catechol 2,3-dioxygenase-like lactoylglutathione lyase family enzyme
MQAKTKVEANVQQAIPFFRVTSMEESLRFYVDGLGFEMTKKWTPDGDGKVRWCWLQHGNAAIMLQEHRREGPNSWTPEGTLGVGVSICFQCKDALAIYKDVKSRGIEAKRPFVGNAMWVTSVTDPDGYKLEFESFTDVPEETVFSESEDGRSS